MRNILSIVCYPDPRLRQVCELIREISDEMIQLSDDMLCTMYNAPGIGLAAPQVGRKERIIVLDVGNSPNIGNVSGGPWKMINPEIIHSEGNVITEEACLSIPGISSMVSRSAKIVVKFLSIDGRKEQIEAEGLLSVCIQHEIDHLNGIIFTDRVEGIRKNLLQKKLAKLTSEK